MTNQAVTVEAVPTLLHQVRLMENLLNGVQEKIDTIEGSINRIKYVAVNGGTEKERCSPSDLVEAFAQQLDRLEQQNARLYTLCEKMKDLV